MICFFFFFSGRKRCEIVGAKYFFFFFLKLNILERVGEKNLEMVSAHIYSSPRTCRSPRKPCDRKPFLRPEFKHGWAAF